MPASYRRFPKRPSRSTFIRRGNEKVKDFSEIWSPHDHHWLFVWIICLWISVPIDWAGASLLEGIVMVDSDVVTIKICRQKYFVIILRWKKIALDKGILLRDFVEYIFD